MFGSFRMTYQGQQIQLGKWLSAKMIHLLLLLICRRGEGVTRSELIQRLYGADENDSQSSNSLRAMIFRLRRSIQESGLPEGEYISTKGGRYTWNNQPLETELDVEITEDEKERVINDLVRKVKMARIDYELAHIADNPEKLPEVIAEKARLTKLHISLKNG